MKEEQRKLTTASPLSP